MGCSSSDKEAWWLELIDQTDLLRGGESASSSYSEEEEHNVDNKLLYSFAHFVHSPLLQSYLLDVEVCRAALTCSFALEVLYICQI